MTKVVANGCFGGFGLSDAAVERYAELAGITLYPKRGSLGFYGWYRVPPEEYDAIEDWAARNEAYFSVNDISRTDPALVQVVEELGEAANDRYARLYIVDIPAGTRYRIDEYDGKESVMTIDDYTWNMA